MLFPLKAFGCCLLPLHYVVAAVMPLYYAHERENELGPQARLHLYKVETDPLHVNGLSLDALTNSLLRSRAVEVATAM